MIEPITDEAIEATLDLVRAAEITAKVVGMTVTQAVEVQLRTAQAMQKGKVTGLDLSGMKGTH